MIIEHEIKLAINQKGELLKRALMHLPETYY